MAMTRFAVGALAVILLWSYLVVAAPSASSAVDQTPPTRPGTITASGVTASAASLKWGPSTDNIRVEGYRVYRGPSASTLALIATTDAVTSYHATALRSNVAYTFGVVAIDAANNQSPMRTATVTTLASADTTAPTAPSSSSVALVAFSSSRIDVVWATSGSSDVAYYEVYRDGALVATVERPSSPRFSDNGLAASSAHSYRVCAVDSAGNRSPMTAAKTAATLSPTAVKIARGPYLSVVTGTSAIVSWWTNIPTSGVLAIGGRTLTDPAGQVRHHAVTVAGLAPGTTYPYTVTSGSASSSGSLHTAAPPGRTFSFAAIGDFGSQSTGEAQNAANIASAGTDFVQTLGDNVYPSAGLPDPDFATVYSDFDARFYKQFKPVLASQALFPANGNKEYYGDGAFWANFPMPGSNHSWYSYDWGDAHILVLDTEQQMAPGSDQYTFAQSDLAAHQADPWRIVALQRPPYSSTSANSSSQPVLQNLVPLFQAQHVDLALSGNSHNYERSYPLRDGARVASGGVTYVVSGAGGNGFNAFTIAQPTWSAFREATYYEFVKVTVSPTALVVDAVRANTNAVFDSTTIRKPGVPQNAVLNADATIDPAASTTPTSSRVRVDASGPTNDLLLKFTSSCTDITAASLGLTVGSGSNDPSTHGGDFYATSAADPHANWAEGSVTWPTAPARDTTVAPVSLGAVTAGTTYSLDVTRLVPSTGGTFTVRGTNTSADGAGYFSKEGSATLGPRLSVTCG
ncbi:MAG: hypothetical protein QOK11_1411 [Pseudonocardiales bacterium]|nr:hypothetical protein [Pseudonocardiales bacterium]